MSSQSEENVVDAPEVSSQDQQAICEQNKRPGEFSSEKFKLAISNLPNKVEFHIIRQLLERQYKVKTHKIKVGRGRAFINFTTQDERDAALKKIDGSSWKGRTLEAKIADPADNPMMKRAKVGAQTCDRDVAENDGPEEANNFSESDINSQVAPLWDKSYEDQLKIKESLMKNALKMSKQVLKFSQDLPKDAPIRLWATKNSGLACPLDGVEPSAVLNGYRNKCEFNVGTDGVVGLRMGRYRNGSSTIVEPPKSCPIFNEIMFRVADAIQDFLQTPGRTKIMGYDHVKHVGHIKQLTVRTNQNKECLVMVDIHPQELTEADLEKETKSIVDMLTKSIQEVKSIYMNISKEHHLNGATTNLIQAYGEGHLYEYLCIWPGTKLRFRIGPLSFFQINTKGAEVLYRTIIELANLGPKSLVLDVGCGTGTISLSLANMVSHVIGIEIVEAAIQDAKNNAKDNDITNVSFFAGRAEDLIGESLTILKSRLSEQNNEGEIVAIVDPPRTGFNSSFIKTIRASSIQKIIYVACDARVNENLSTLCRPTSKAYQGEPFVPTKAKAIDLFPFTKCCELILVYERLNLVKLD